MNFLSDQTFFFRTSFISHWDLCSSTVCWTFNSHTHTQTHANAYSGISSAFSSVCAATLSVWVCFCVFCTRCSSLFSALYLFCNFFKWKSFFFLRPFLIIGRIVFGLRLDLELPLPLQQHRNTVRYRPTKVNVFFYFFFSSFGCCLSWNRNFILHHFTFSSRRFPSLLCCSVCVCVFVCHSVCFQHHLCFSFSSHSSLVRSIYYYYYLGYNVPTRRSLNILKWCVLKSER